MSELRETVAAIRTLADEAQEAHLDGDRTAYYVRCALIVNRVPQLLAAAEAVERVRALADGPLVPGSVAERIREALAAADPTLAPVAGEETA